MSEKTDSQPRSASPKPLFWLAIATGLGAGYIPIAPGTFGALEGVGITAWLIHLANVWVPAVPLAKPIWSPNAPLASFFANQLWASLLVAVFGLWAAYRAEIYLEAKDPQNIVIDEVSGQMIAYLGLATAGPIPHYWKYLLLGFILFRVFDIWKPFPARRAEALPGGWGIMADDWIAGIYAALVLWLAHTAGF
jgi:phosphatidylglycerophosphatase A